MHKDDKAKSCDDESSPNELTRRTNVELNLATSYFDFVSVFLCFSSRKILKL